MLALEETNIKNMIYTIRGQQVMLDSDLARLYQCSNGTKSINLACKRNEDKFPERYRFQLNDKEIENLRFQFETTNSKSRSNPYVFSEQGVAMLATILKTPVATKVSMDIIDAFVEMRHYFLENQLLIGDKELTKLGMQTIQNTKDIIEMKETMATKDDIALIMDNFIDESKIKEFVFVDGQKFEADEAYITIYKLAKKSIYVVDDYVSIKTLSHLKHKDVGVDIILLTDNKGGRDKLQSAEVIDFQNQYPTLEIRGTFGLVHDRLIVIDYGTSDERIYLCGASSKDAGSKFCTILEVHNKAAYHGVVDTLLKNESLVL